MVREAGKDEEKIMDILIERNNRTSSAETMESGMSANAYDMASNDNYE